eukprot:scaffold212203_cov33-Tisochrysis_lutea.AAC.4
MVITRDLVWVVDARRIVRSRVADLEERHELLQNVGIPERLRFADVLIDGDALSRLLCQVSEALC